MFIVCLLFNHSFLTIINIYSLLRGLAVEAPAVEGVPAITPLALWRGVGCEADAGLLALAEAEVEGADGVDGAGEVDVEVGAAGADGHGVAGPVEGAGGAEVETALVASGEGHGAVGAAELDGLVAAVRGDDGGRGAVADGDAGEGGADEVVAAGPLDDIGPSGLDGRGLLEVEVERAVGGEAGLVAAVVAVGVHLHERAVGAEKGRHLRGGHREGQAERVPLVVLVEGAAQEHDVTGLAVGEGGDALGVAESSGGDDGGVVVVEDGGAAGGGGLGDAGHERLAVEVADAAGDVVGVCSAAVPQRLAVLHLEPIAIVGETLAKGGDVVGGAGPAEGDGLVICLDAVTSRAGGVDDATKDGDIATGIDGRRRNPRVFDIQCAVALLLAVDGEVTSDFDSAAFVANAERLAVAEDEVDIFADELEHAGDGGVAADHIPAGGAGGAKGDVAAAVGDGRVVAALLLDAVAVEIGDDGQELVEVYGDVVCGHGERRAVDDFGGLVLVVGIGGGEAGPLSRGHHAVVG